LTVAAGAAAVSLAGRSADGQIRLRRRVAEGGKVLFVGTKRQAAPSIMTCATESNQYYVNNRWLGGMLTNWKTVKKSIDRYNQYIEILGSEEKKAELSKKELASMTRQVEKYDKSLAGIRSMQRVPDAIFIIDVGKEAIAVSEGSRLHIPIIGIVDTNCSPRKIDFVVPGNDDAIRAIDLFCTAAANACREGFAKHQAELIAQKKNEPEKAKSKSDSAPKTGRRVVEIKQQPRRGRGQSAAGGGKSYSAGGAKSGGGAKPTGSAQGEDAKPKTAASATPATSASGPTTSTSPTPPTTPPASAEGEKKE
jgi:small subunit ribosomal protein S2